MERCSKAPRHASLLRKFPVHSLPTLRGVWKGEIVISLAKSPLPPLFKGGSRGIFMMHGWTNGP